MALTLGALAVFGSGLLLGGEDGVGRTGLTVAVGLYAAISSVAWVGARNEKLDSFGLANAVTLVRLALASIVAGYAAEIADGQVSSTPATVWLITGIAVLALATDACDGWVARRLGTESSFGARFDMETDAVLTLVLCVLVRILDKAGPWILAAGLMRYLFVAAGLLWPILNAPLPPSMRRKCVCVLQIAALIVVLAPAVPPDLSAPIGLAALIVLVWSFAIDVAWLILAPRQTKLAA